MWMGVRKVILLLSKIQYLSTNYHVRHLSTNYHVHIHHVYIETNQVVHFMANWAYKYKISQSFNKYHSLSTKLCGIDRFCMFIVSRDAMIYNPFSFSIYNFFYFNTNVPRGLNK